MAEFSDSENDWTDDDEADWTDEEGGALFRGMFHVVL